MTNNKKAELQGAMWRLQQASKELSPWDIRDVNKLWGKLLLVLNNVTTAVELLEELEADSQVEKELAE